MPQRERAVVAFLEDARLYHFPLGSARFRDRANPGESPAANGATANRSRCSAWPARSGCSPEPATRTLSTFGTVGPSSQPAIPLLQRPPTPAPRAWSYGGGTVALRCWSHGGRPPWGQQATAELPPSQQQATTTVRPPSLAWRRPEGTSVVTGAGVVQGAAFNTTCTSKPCGTAFRAVTVPWQASTQVFTIARPRPAPPVSRLREGSPR